MIKGDLFEARKIKVLKQWLKNKTSLEYQLLSNKEIRLSKFNNDFVRVISICEEMLLAKINYLVDFELTFYAHRPMPERKELCMLLECANYDLARKFVYPKMSQEVDLYFQICFSTKEPSIDIALYRNGVLQWSKKYLTENLTSKFRELLVYKNMIEWGF